jgi:hypothetical protein
VFGRLTYTSLWWRFKTPSLRHISPLYVSLDSEQVVCIPAPYLLLVLSIFERSYWDMRDVTHSLFHKTGSLEHNLLRSAPGILEFFTRALIVLLIILRRSRYLHYLASNGRIINDWWIGRDSEGRGLHLIEALSLYLPGGLKKTKRNLKPVS